MKTFVLLSCVALLASASRPLSAQTAAAPELFGAGVFSTGNWDFFLALSPDQRHAWFCQANENFTDFRIFQTHKDAAGHWAKPVAPRFAADWGNADPHLSPDGKTLYFISNRATPDDNGFKPAFHVWSVDLAAGGDKSVRLPAPVNIPGSDDWSPSIAVNGDLYFGSDRTAAHAGFNIWVSHRTPAGYTTIEELGDSINTAGNEVEPWIAPDGSYLIFSGSARSDSTGQYDLYLSRRINGVWQSAHPVPGGINTAKSEFNQSVSPDGKWLYFSSDRPLAGSIGQRVDFPRDDFSIQGIGNGKGDIYRVPMSALGL